MIQDYTKLKRNYFKFIKLCEKTKGRYSLTPNADPSDFARCFAVFGLHAIGERDLLENNRSQLVSDLISGVTDVRRQASKGTLASKSYRQLIAFTLSALKILDALQDKPLRSHVVELIPHDIEHYLLQNGVFRGAPRSGNFAMFIAIYLEYLRRFCGVDNSHSLNDWIDLHLSSMNKFGFWGPGQNITHLHFQNGFHQYEILEYFGVNMDNREHAVSATATLVDPNGHFAPYPGGGGCYDYDATCILTPHGKLPAGQFVRETLKRTSATIFNSQQPNGGFAENLLVRPRINAITGYFERLTSAKNFALFKERGKHAINLQRRKHNLISTHWSVYSRRWDEPNLWDTWFRSLTLARINYAFGGFAQPPLNFIDFPGIGWHPSFGAQNLSK